MGQGLAPAEPATSAAASCLLRRRRRAIGAIVVCGPSLGCPFDECGAHSAAPDLPAQRFRHERGAKIWIWRPQADRSKIPKDFWERVWQTRSPALREAGLACGRRVAAFSQRVSLLGERKQSKSIDYIRAQSCELVGHGCNPAAPRLDCISRKPRGTRAVTRRRSEPSHSSAHRCKQCSRRRAPPPGRYSSSAFVIAPTASSTTRTGTNR